MNLSTNNTNFSLLGNKFYIIDDNDNVKIIRVIKEKGNDDLTAKVENEDITFKTSFKELKEQGYTKLVSDGILIFSVVKIGVYPETTIAIDDVMITLYRRNELANKETMPYAVCRQNINDIFYQNMYSDVKTSYVGLSCTRDSFPEKEGLNFYSTLACDEVYPNLSTVINVYIQDTLDDILPMVKVSKYNNILEGLRNAYINDVKSEYKSKGKTLPIMIALDPISKPPIMGFCNTLKELIETNNFMYDFDCSFNIIPVEFKMDYDKESGQLYKGLIPIFESLLKEHFGKSFVLEYDHDVDLSELKCKYALIRDKNKKLYILGFIEEGEYLETDEEIIQLKENMQNYLSYSKNKYQ